MVASIVRPSRPTFALGTSAVGHVVDDSRALGPRPIPVGDGDGGRTWLVDPSTDERSLQGRRPDERDGGVVPR